MNRRSFVRVAGTAAGSVALAGCASLVAYPVSPVAGKVLIDPRNHPSLSGEVGQLKLRVEGMAVPLYLLADGAGGYTAVSPVCTHLGCTVGIEGAALVCPCHGSTYTRDGTVVRGPAEKNLTAYRVERLTGGTLSINLEETI